MPVPMPPTEIVAYLHWTAYHGSAGKMIKGLRTAATEIERLMKELDRVRDEIKELEKIVEKFTGFTADKLREKEP